jgi:AcrR family transcriptional regulator
MLKGSSDSDQMRRKPQQARSIERVNHILKIADEVFAEMGFEAATTIEIAARAKISVGSLYRFFPDKAGNPQGSGRKLSRKVAASYCTATYPRSC